MPIITLLTDFGTTDPYVGIMKGVILQINPHAKIVDISHGIDPQDVVQAAYDVAYTCRFFPADSVHVIVVDPGVGSGRAVLGLRSGSQTLLAPDNGILTQVLRDDPKQELVRVTNQRIFRQPVSRTFHGRDIFAPAAAHLSLGLPLAKLGDQMAPEEAVRLEISKPRLAADGGIIGSIVAVDRFGNLITDIEPEDVRRFFPDADQRDLLFGIGDRKIFGSAETYTAVEPGELLVVTGSRGAFEISVNRGSAAETLGCRRGDRLTVQPAGRDSRTMD